MKTPRFDKDRIVRGAKTGCRFAIFALAAVLPYLSKKETLDMIRYSGDVKYSDAVEAIMTSSMWSEDKRRAVELLSKEGDSEIYKAIIKITRSSMWSEDKLKTIKDICCEK